MNKNKIELGMDMMYMPMMPMYFENSNNLTLLFKNFRTSKINIYNESA